MEYELTRGSIVSDEDIEKMDALLCEGKTGFLGKSGAVSVSRPRGHAHGTYDNSSAFTLVYFNSNPYSSAYLKQNFSSSGKSCSTLAQTISLSTAP